MNSNLVFRFASLTSAVLLALAAPSLQAQDAANTPAEADVEVLQVHGSRLDSAATATGLPLTLRETPQSVSIIDQTFISTFALDSVAEIMALSPGIQVQQAETNRYFFRARGNDITNFQFDGVPVQYSSFFNEAVTDSILFERIELVRGASGLLSGVGEPSAAINLIRKRPKAEPAGYANVRLGSRDSLRLEADQSLNLTEDGAVQARFAAAYEEFDGYVNLAKEDNLQLYGVTTAALGSTTRLTVGVDYSERNPQGSTWGALPLFYADGTAANDISRATTTAASWSSWQREGLNAFATLEHGFSNGWDLKLELERRHDEMDGHLLYLSGFPDKTTGLGMNAFPMIYQAERDQDSLRLFASGPYQLFGREHQLTSGLLYSKQDMSAKSFYSSDRLVVGNFWQWDGSIAEPSYPSQPFTDSAVDRQKGLYIASQFNLHDRLTLILGNRFSSYEMAAAADYKHSNINTPYAGIVFDIAEKLSLYSSYTEIFQPQNARDANNKRLDPVEGSNIEVGIKGDFFNEAVTASIAVFKVEKDNVAERDPNFTAPLPDGSFPMRGVKGTNSKGYELELTGKPADALDLYFSYTHNTSEQADGSAFATYLPDDMLRFSAIYRLHGSLAPVTLGTNINWQSKITQPNVGPNGETAAQPAYTLVNLMASYDINQQLIARLNVRNLFDKKYYSSIDFYNQGFFGAPRTIEASLSYHW